MSTIVYYWDWGGGGRDKFLLAKPKIRANHGCGSSGEALFFKRDSDQLVSSNERYSLFSSLAEATAAAEEMGFTVLPNPPETQR